MAGVVTHPHQAVCWSTEVREPDCVSEEKMHEDFRQTFRHLSKCLGAADLSCCSLYNKQQRLTGQKYGATLKSVNLEVRSETASAHTVFVYGCKSYLSLSLRVSLRKF